MLLGADIDILARRIHAENTFFDVHHSGIWTPGRV
jgi:hypothetical protein